MYKVFNTRILITEADDKDDAVILDELKEVEDASSSTKSEADVIRPAPSKLRRNGRRYVKQITKVFSIFY